MTTPDQDSFRAVHSTLLNIVCLSLDSDPALIPSAAKALQTPEAGSVTSIHEHNSTGANDHSLTQQVDGHGREPNDFVIMSEIQAKRIVSLTKMAFGVELSNDVVIAEANVEALARRVVGARSLFSIGTGRADDLARHVSSVR